MPASGGASSPDSVDFIFLDETDLVKRTFGRGVASKELQSGRLPAYSVSPLLSLEVVVFARMWCQVVTNHEEVPM